MFVISETRYLSASAKRRSGKWEGPGDQVLSILGLGDEGSLLQFVAFLSQRSQRRLQRGGDLSKVSQ